MNIDVLACLLNYKRPNNLREIIHRIRTEQSVPVRIAVWNNGEEHEQFPEADYVIQAPHNMMCMPRWHVAALLGKDYVFSLDDDLCPQDPDLIRNCIRYSQKHDNNIIIGKTGLTIGTAPEYYKTGNSKAPLDDEGTRRVDIVKGRFMFFHVQLLQNTPLYAAPYHGRGDDIWISLTTAKEAAHHHIPTFIGGAFFNFPEENVALNAHPSHSALRTNLIADLIAQGWVSWRKAKLKDRLHRKIWRMKTRRFRKR